MSVVCDYYGTFYSGLQLLQRNHILLNIGNITVCVFACLDACEDKCEFNTGVGTFSFNPVLTVFKHGKL